MRAMGFFSSNILCIFVKTFSAYGITNYRIRLAQKYVRPHL